MKWKYVIKTGSISTAGFMYNFQIPLHRKFPQAVTKKESGQKKMWL